MRNRAALFSSAIVFSVVGVVAFAAPANAVDTPVSVAVTGGSLSIAATPTNIAIPGFVASPQAVGFSIVLGDVTVTDARGTAAGWAASVSAADFTATGGLTIPLAGATYSAPAATTTGTVTVVPATSTTLGTATAINTATATGANTATWSPTIAATAPVGTQVGEYSTIVVHSVL